MACDAAQGGRLPGQLCQPVCVKNGPRDSQQVQAPAPVGAKHHRCRPERIGGTEQHGRCETGAVVTHHQHPLMTEVKNGLQSGR